jgi:hypothetical protein
MDVAASTPDAGQQRSYPMARFIVERTFPEGLAIPTDAGGAAACLGVVEKNAEESVTWLTSFVLENRTKTWCIYDGPDADAIRRAATANGLPADSINEVRVLDPYFYVSTAPPNGGSE